MNLTIAKEQIINGLQAVQNVVSTRTTLPILSNVLLRAEGDKLELTATDLDVTVSSSVEAKVKKPGASTVPVKRLFGIIRELANSEIDLEVDDKHVCSVRSGASFYKINGLSADEFPPLAKFKEEKKVVLPQETVGGMMKKTSFAISTDESRYVLNGIFISLKDHKMTMVATDGRRLALVDEEVDVSEKSQGEFIIPAKAVNELNRLLQDKGELEIRYTENQASFTLKDDKGSGVLIVSKLIEGNYPNYRQVIPKKSKSASPWCGRNFCTPCAAPRS
jgi:DNA polymerase III, beta subunit